MSQDPLIGVTVDNRYRITRKVGDGGMGIVYEAEQVSVDRKIAIKMLHKQLARDPGWVHRFYNEAKSCSLLKHPNTVRMFDFGQTSDGQLFLAMEFLDGVSLKDAIWAQGTMEPERVIHIVSQVCGAMVEAHAVGIVHRDIKPDNIFILQIVGRPDFVKVLDFSVAKLMQEGGPKTMAGITFGTPQYMSPEQSRGTGVDARTDIYSLGIIAYEMLVGQVPFNGASPLEILEAVAGKPVPPLPSTVPPAVREIVTKATDKDPNRRFQNASEMMRACEEALMTIGKPHRSRTASSAPSPASQPTDRNVALGQERAEQPTVLGDAAPPSVATAAAQSEISRPQMRAPRANPLLWVLCLSSGAAVGTGAFALYLRMIG